MPRAGVTEASLAEGGDAQRPEDRSITVGRGRQHAPHAVGAEGDAAAGDAQGALPAVGQAGQQCELRRGRHFRRGAAAGAKSKKRARDERANWEGGQFTNWPKMCAEIAHRRTRNLPNATVIVEGYTLFYDHPELQACRERADAIIVLEIGKETCQKRRRSFPSKGGWACADDYVRHAVWPHYEEHELPRINRAAGRIIRIDGTSPEEAVTNTAVAALSEAF